MGGEVRERDEDEGAFVQSFVRNDERRRIEDKVIVEQDIQVNETRPPAKARLASQLNFKRLQFSEKGFWLEPRPRVGSHVEERGLVGEAPRGSLEDSRNRDRLNVGRQRAEGGAQVGQSVSEIGPEGEVNVMSHISANIS